MRTIYFFSFYLLTYFANGQSLILKNGKIIEAKKVEIDNKRGGVQVKSQGEDVFFPAEEIWGFFESCKKPVLYLMPVPTLEETIQLEFLEHASEGELVLGRFFLFTGYATANGVSYKVKEPYLTAVKEDQHHVIYGEENLEKMVMRFKAITIDIPSFSTRIDSLASSKWSEEGVIALANQYNMEKYTPGTVESSGLSPVIIFLKPTKSTPSVQISVDDAKPYELTTKRPYSLGLPAFQIRKVCASSNGSRNCLMIRSTPLCLQYFQVEQDVKNQTIKFTLSNETEATYYIKKGK